MSNNTTQNLISFDEFIRLSRLKGADFGKGDPYNRLRYYIKTGLLPKASRKSFNGLPPSGALPIEAVDTLVEIDEKIKEGRSIQQIIKGAKNPVVNEEFSTPHPIEITPQNSLLPLEGGYNNSVNLGSFPAGNTASSDISALVAPELVPVNDDSGTTLRRRNFLPRIGLTKGRFFILGLEGMTLILGLIVLLSIYHLNTSKPVTSGSVVVDKNHLPKITAQEPGSTLGSSVQDGLLSVFVPTNLAGQLTAGGGIVTNDTDVNAGTGKLTASNVIYSLTAGANVSITGGQNPTISAVAASVNGTSNRISVSSGKVDIASNYAGQTSITTLGTVTTGTWEAGTISDPFVSDSLTISSSSSVDWLALTNFPTTCGAGNFVRAVGTTLTCALDQVGGSSPQNILQDGVFLQTASSLNFVTADVNVTSDSGTQVSISLPDTGVANGSYGSATQVATFTVDTKGRLTAAGNTTISLTDANVSDTLTIDSSSSVSATAINSGTLGNAGVTLALASFGSITGSLPDANVSNSLTLDNTSSVSATAINSGTLGNAGVTLALASFGSITGTVAVANGGTSISSYTIGDILYASGATTLSKLADVATGNVLISGGVGAAPSWGKVGLTTHVSGVLPIANGGTNGSAAPTNGGIAYGTGTAYAFTAAGGGTQCLLGGTPPVFGSCGAGSGGATISDGTNTVTAVTTENFNTYFTVSPNGGTVTAGITLKTGSVDNAILTNSSITFAGDSSSSATALGGTRTISGGNGLTSTDNGSGTLTVNVGAGTGILANANDVAVDQAFSPTWTGLHTFTPGSTNDTVFNGDNDSNLQIASTFSGTGPTINPIDITLTDNATAAGTANIVNIKNADNGANAGVPAALLHLDNANAAETVTNGLFVEQSGAGTLTSAIGIKQTSGTITNLLKYDNGTNTAAILKPTLSGNQTYTLPDASGTLADSGNLGDALQFSSSLFDVKLGTTGGSSSANFSGLQKISANGLSLLSCADTQILKKAGTNWTCSSDNTGSGSVGGAGTQYTIAMFSNLAGDQVGNSIITQDSGATTVTVGGSLVADDLTLTGLTTDGVVTNTSGGVIGTLAGTTTTILHGNASGLPTFGAVVLTTDVSGTLPIANGGTNSNSAIGGAGAVVYSDGTKYAYGGTTGTAGLCLLSGVSGTGQPTWGSCGAGASGQTYSDGVNPDVTSATKLTFDGNFFVVGGATPNATVTVKDDSLDFPQFKDTLALDANLTLNQSTSTWTQNFTGTTTTGLTYNANSLTTGSAFVLNSSNNSAANTAWSSVVLNPTNAQGTTAVSSGSIAGLDIQFSQNTSISGNNETVARFNIAQNNSSSTDATVDSIIAVANNDTASGNQITATDGIKITGANITNGIELAGTFGTNLITSTNFTVAQSGAVTAGTYNGQTISATASFTGTLNVATGFKVAGAAASGNYLRGDGTNFVSSTLLTTDLSGTLFTLAGDSGSGTVSQGNTVTVAGGNGLTSSVSGTTATITVGAGTGILANANDVAVDQAFSPTWTGAHTFTPGSSSDVVLNTDNDSNVQVSGTFSGTGPSQSLVDIQLTHNATAAGTSYLLSLINNNNGANAGVPDALARFRNDNAAETVNNGLLIEQNGAGTLTNGLQIVRTSGTISNAILVNGTTTTILNTPTLDISGAGAVTGATGISSSGTIAFSGLSTDGPVYTSGGTGTLNSEQYLALSRGGTNNTISPSMGQVVYSDSSKLLLTSGGSNTNCLKLNTTTGAYWDACPGGSATSPFISSGGEIVKDSGFTTDKVHLTSAEAGDYGLLVDTGIANTTSLFQVSNSGFGYTATGANLADLNFTQADDADATDTNSALNIAVTSSSGDADALNGINIAALSAGSATENAINVGAGWDFGLVIGSANNNNIYLSTVAAGAIGLQATLANVTSANVTGVRVNTGTITTGGTQNAFLASIAAVSVGTTNGLQINPPSTSTSGGTINGIALGSITTSNGTDVALNIGSGWDQDILFITDSTHTLKVQDQDTAATAGSALAITGAAGNTSGAGGAFTFTSGQGGATGVGGDINLTSGAGGATSGNSGALTFLTGNTTSGTAGNISVDVGTSTSGNGSILIGTAARAQTITIGNSTGGAVRLGQNGSTVQIDGTNVDVSTAGVLTLAGAQAADITTQSSNALTLTPGGTGQLVLNSSNTSASAVDINATGTVAGNAITLDTTNGGIALTAAGASNGDITISPTDDFTLDGTAGSLINIGTSAVTQTITIGATTNTDLALRDAQWSVTGAGVATFVSGTVIGSQTFTTNNIVDSGALTLQSGSGTNLSLLGGTSAQIKNIQIGAGGAGSSTPDFLALDVYNTTGDPAGGAEGYIYYNTSDNKFRCFQGSAWADCISTGSSSVRLDQITAANTTASIDSLNNAISWNWSTLATERALTLDSTSTGLTTGGVLALGSSTTAYNHGAANTGSLATLTFKDATSGAFASTTNGLLLSPEINITAGAATKTINGISVNPSFTACTTATCNVNGINVAGVTDSGNFNGTALNVGTGWDTILSGTTAGTNLISFTNFSVTTAGAGTLASTLAVNGSSLTTSSSTFTLLAGATTTLNIGPTGSNGSIVLSGGSADTGCTLDGTTGGLTCSGNISGASTGTVGYWTRSGTTLSPATANDLVTISTVPSGSTGLTVTTAAVSSGTTTAIAGTTGTITTTGTQNAFLGTLGAISAGVANGIKLAISNPSGGTVNGFNFPAISGGGADVNAVLIGNLTAGAGGETAINIGTGWDTEINFSDPTARIILGGNLAFTDGGNTLCTITDAGSTGTLTCTGDITGPSTGTVGYWTRSGTTLSPATAADVISLGTLGNASTGLAATLANSSSGTSNGVSITTGTLSSGTQNAFLATLSAATNGTINGLKIVPPATTGGTTNGILIGDITTSTGTDIAINVGALWDNSINLTQTTGTVVNYSAASGAGFISGTLINNSYTGGNTQTGTITGLNMDFNTNFTARVAAANTVGVTYSSPSLTQAPSSTFAHIFTGYDVPVTGAITNSSSATQTFNGFNIGSSTGTNVGALVQNTNGGTINWRGVNVALPAITQSTGTVAADGARIVFPASSAITTGGTINGVNIVAPTTSGPAVGSINGINIAAFTSQNTSSDIALNIGSGWDAGISTASNIYANQAPTITSVSQALSTVVSGAGTGVDNVVAIGHDGMPFVVTYGTANLVLNFYKCLALDCSSVSASSSGGSVAVRAYPSVAIRPNGNPIISYFHDTVSPIRDIYVYDCANPACTTGTDRAIETTNDIGQYSSIAIGTDGNPVISYYDFTGGNLNLRVAKCTTSNCSSVGAVNAEATNDVGQYSAIAVPADGLPVVAFYDNTNGDLRVLKCSTASCSSITASTLVDGSAGGVNVGKYNSIAIGVDGLPIISYYDVTNTNLKVAKCTNANCSSSIVTTQDSTNDVGQYSSITIGTDGLPVISYFDNTPTPKRLKIAKCVDISCSGTPTTTSITAESNAAGQYTSIAIGTDGLPIAAYQETATPAAKVLHCATGSCSASSGSYASSIDLGSLNVGIRNLYGLAGAFSGDLFVGATPGRVNNNVLGTTTPWGEGNLTVTGTTTGYGGITSVIPSNATGTTNGFTVTPPVTTTAGGTLNGINIGNVTTSNGTDVAINIGSGWDTAIKMTGLNSITATAATTFSSSQTASTILAINPSAAVSLLGNLTGITLDVSGNYYSSISNKTIIGQQITTADNIVDSTGTNIYTGLAIANAGIGGVSQTSSSGGSVATTYSGISLTLPNFTQSGTDPLVGNGVFTTLGTISTGGTENGEKIVIPDSGSTSGATLNGVLIAGTGTSGVITTGAAGTLNGIRINGITTAGAGAETALSIGAGWDTGISVTTAAAETGLSVAAGAIPTTDMVKLDNTGFGLTTTGINALQIDYITTATAGNQSWAAIQINTTSGASGSSDNLFGIGIGSLTSSTAGPNENAINIGPSWDSGVNFGLLTTASGGWTEGMLIRNAYSITNSATQTGNLTGVSLDFSTNFTAQTGAARDIKGYTFITPSLSESGNFNHTYSGLTVSANVSAGFGTGSTSTGTLDWNGADITLPAISQVTGSTVTANGVKVSFPASAQITTGGTENGLYVVGPSTSGPTVGNLNGVNIGPVTSAGIAYENAINVGDNWDTGLLVNGGGAAVVTPWGGFGRGSNLLKYSEDFGNTANWTVSASTGVSVNAVAAPDGNTTADELQFNGSGSDEIINTSSSAAGSTTYTGSVWLKFTSARTIRIGVRDSAGSPASNTTTAYVTTGWQRFSVTKAFSSGTGNVVFFIDDNGDTSAAYSVDAWGAQLEATSTAGVYVATNTTTVATTQRGFQAEGTAFFNQAFTASGSLGIKNVTNLVSTGSNAAVTGINSSVTYAGSAGNSLATIGVDLTNTQNSTSTLQQLTGLKITNTSTASTGSGSITLLKAISVSTPTWSGGVPVTATGIDIVDQGGSGTTTSTAINIGNSNGNATTKTGISIGTGWDNAIVANGDIQIGKQTDSVTALAKVSNAAGTVADDGGATTAIDNITAMAVYNGSLFVGTTDSTAGAEVYRYDGGSNWTQLNVTGTAGKFNTLTGIDGVSSMTVFNGQLYIGTSEGDKAEVYRYDGGTTWTAINTTNGRFDAAATIDKVTAMTVYGGNLYIGVTESNAGQVFRYNSGTGTSVFTTINTTAGTFNTTGSVDGVAAMVVFNEKLYIGTNEPGNGTQVLSYDGNVGTTVFTRINTTAGTLNTTSGIDQVTAMTVYNGDLYVGTTDATALAEVYRYDGTTTGAAVFTALNTTAGTFDTQANVDGVSAMAVYNGLLYIGTNEADKAQVLSYNGGVGAAVFTKLNATAGTITTQANVDTVSVLQSYAGFLYDGTSETDKAEVQKYAAIEGQSFALKFNAVSDNGSGVENNSLLNLGQISFLAEQNALNNTGNSGTGVFMFTHGITTATGAYDVAEDYPTRDDSLGAGDVVSIDKYERGFITKTSNSYNDAILGVYSGNPALHLSQKDTSISGGRAVPVALVGRVDVKVTSENGAIQQGDPLTSSSKAGVAMKATQPGPIVGHALASWDNSDPAVIGKISVAVKTGYWAPSLASGATAPSGQENITTNDLIAMNLTAEKVTVNDTLVIGDKITMNKDGKLTVDGSVVVVGAIKLTGDLTVSGKIEGGTVAAAEIQIKGKDNNPDATAGVATIAAGTDELVINTTKVDDKTLVFVTPTKQTDKQLAVIDKISGTSFKVKLNTTAAEDLTFNWLIVNQQISQGN